MRICELESCGKIHSHQRLDPLLTVCQRHKNQGAGSVSRMGSVWELDSVQKPDRLCLKEKRLLAFNWLLEVFKLNLKGPV